ncbi:MAG: TSUP family transporter [Salinigranum sp.]
MTVAGIAFTTATILVAVAVLLFAGTVKGTLGFGVGVSSLPLLMLVFPTKTALAVLTIPFVITNLSVLYRDGVPWRFLRSHAVFLVLLAAATVVGSYSLAVLPVRAVYAIVSLYLFGFLLFRRYDEGVYAYADRRGVSTAAGTAGGFLGGALGMPGPPLITYTYLKVAGDKRLFVTGLSSMFVVTYGMRLPALFSAHMFGADELLLGGIATLPLLAGVYFGTHVRDRTPRRRFESFVELFILVVAVKIGLDALGVAL